MFLGGANTNVAELRTPSLKGVIRFWWRAVHGEQPIHLLKEREKLIFGDTTQKSSTTIHIEPVEKLKTSIDLKQRGEKFTVHGRPMHILDYLAYGTHKYERGKGNVYHKEHIEPGNRFKVSIDYETQYEEEILSTLGWVVHYGGLGARSRNGFGSIWTKIEQPKITNVSKTANFTAISEETRLFIFSRKSSWHLAHSEVGLAYRTARLKTERRLHQYERRKLISAPITVNKKNVADLERHAKPYFLHVNKLADGSYQGQILFVPYKYLSGHFDFTPKKLSEYRAACEDLNKNLTELSGGAI